MALNKRVSIAPWHVPPSANDRTVGIHIRTLEGCFWASLSYGPLTQRIASDRDDRNGFRRLLNGANCFIPWSCDDIAAPSQRTAMRLRRREEW
jgi:hypothetical protein